MAGNMAAKSRRKGALADTYTENGNVVTVTYHGIYSPTVFDAAMTQTRHILEKEHNHDRQR